MAQFFLYALTSSNITWFSKLYLFIRNKVQLIQNSKKKRRKKNKQTNYKSHQITFHYQNQEKMYNNTITKDPTTLQVCRYTTLWYVKCLQSNIWKQDDFCNNIFLKKLTRNNVK